MIKILTFRSVFAKVDSIVNIRDSKSSVNGRDGQRLQDLDSPETAFLPWVFDATIPHLRA